MEFYSTAAQVIPTLLIVAALQSSLLSWAADKYVDGGCKRKMGQAVMFSIGASLMCEGLALTVMFVNREWLTSSWLARGIVLFGCIPALFAAWGGGHLDWKTKRDAAKKANR